MSKSQKYQVRAEPQITKRSVPLRPARRDTQNGLLMGEKRTPDDPRKAKTRNQQDKALWIDPVFCQDRSGVSGSIRMFSETNRSVWIAGSKKGGSILQLSGPVNSCWIDPLKTVDGSNSPQNYSARASLGEQVWGVFKYYF